MKNFFNLKIAGLILMAFAIGCANSDNTNKTQNNSVQNKSNSNVASSSPSSKDTTAKSGWNPQDACAYLNDVDGLQTRGYKNLASDEKYTCSSDYKKLGSETPLPNTIAYYANGDAKTVNELKLVINVNVKDKGKDAQTTLADYSQKLTEKALGEKMPPEAQTAIQNGKAGKWTVGEAKLEVEREDWSTGKGYEMSYILQKSE